MVCEALSTQGVVTPNIMQPMSGLLSAADILGAEAMPTMPQAALVSICLVRLFSPASAMGYIMQMSLVPT